MRKIHRRSFIRSASATSAGIILCNGAIASAESAGDITINNDYTDSVTIQLFHPSGGIDAVFAQWTFEPSEEALLSYEDHHVQVKSDWGIRVSFDNGEQSAIMRLGEVGYPDTIIASDIYDLPFAEYPQGNRITNVGGYEIDSTFGEAETEILRAALGIFYERFLQPYTHGCPEICTRAGWHITDDFPRGDFTDEDGDEIDPLDILEVQRERLTYNAVILEEPFPKIQLEYVYDEDEDFVAKAPPGIVRVLPREEGESSGPYPVDGSFLIRVNDWYVNRTSRNEHFGNPAYWAGVLAHEALHNLGHRHPTSRDDEQYYLHQMIIVEHMVMKNDKVRYGDSNETPVLCRPWS